MNHDFIIIHFNLILGKKLHSVVLKLHQTRFFDTETYHNLPGVWLKEKHVRKKNNNPLLRGCPSFHDYVLMDTFASQELGTISDPKSLMHQPF